MDNTPSLSNEEILVSADQAKWTEQVRSGASWLFAIAALSLLNSIIALFGGDTAFVVGLGVTQFVDGFALGMAQELPDWSLIIRIVAFGISLGISGVLGVLGFFGRKGKAWAFYLAAAGYFIDAIIVFAFGDFLGGVFHLIALFFIVRGALAAGKFNQTVSQS